MKNIFNLLFIFFSCQILAQDKFPVCTETYFTNKKISTKQCTDSSRRQGKAYAYNLEGKIIGEWELSRMHMYSSVNFTFHANGAVHKAKYSSHPDGGIQWYRSTTTFNDKGEKTDFWEESNESENDLFGPGKPSKPNIIKEEKPKEEKVQQDQTEIAPIRKMSFMWVENTTKKKLLITYYDKNTFNNEDTVWVNAGEKKKIILKMDNREFKDPYELHDFKITNEKGKSKKYKILAEAKIEDLSLQKNEKNYYHLLKK